jgi:nucleoside-diphosphate-sugar epimerase
MRRREMTSAGPVFITGSSGQLGTEVSRQLRAAGTATRGLDLVPGEFTEVVGDLRDRAAIDAGVAGASAVVHIASLHAPHVATHTRDDFLDINVAASMYLLAATIRAGIDRFVYTSTTSVYGNAMVHPDHAVWVTETIEPQPRDMYDESKLMAEQMCRSAAASAPALTITVLRTCRFFEEPPETMAIHRLYRGADIRDVAAAHALALGRRGPFDILNVAGPYEFDRDDLETLKSDAPAAIRRYYPDAERAFAERGWHLPRSIDRVYVSDAARRAIGYAPRFGFTELLAARD